MSYTDQVLLALLRHGRCNTRQLATTLSHDHQKTVSLVAYMRTNKKIKLDGMIDDMAAYTLTDTGLELAKKLLGSGDAKPSAAMPAVTLGDTALEIPQFTAKSTPGPNSLEDLAFPQKDRAPASNSTAGTRTNPIRTLTSEPVPVLIQPPRFGRLNTGEFIVMHGPATIIIPAEQMPELQREVATGGAHG